MPLRRLTFGMGRKVDAGDDEAGSVAIDERTSTAEAEADLRDAVSPGEESDVPAPTIAPTGDARGELAPMPEVPAQTIQYAKRISRMDKQDWGWWVEGDYLIESDGKGATSRVHLGDVLEVQTTPSPAKFRPWRHQTILGLRNARRIVIDNASFTGVANYEDRSETYAPFVRELIGVIAAKTPYAKARRGASYLGYMAMIAFVVVLIALMATLLFLLPIEGVPGINFIKAGLVLLMAPPLLAWVVKSKPSGMPLAELPPGAFPSAGP